MKTRGRGVSGAAERRWLNSLGGILGGLALHREIDQRQRRRIELAGNVAVVQVLGDRFARDALPVESVRARPAGEAMEKRDQLF